MKKNYLKAQLRVVLSEEDIITTSSFFDAKELEWVSSDQEW